MYISFGLNVFNFTIFINKKNIKIHLTHGFGGSLYQLSYFAKEFNLRINLLNIILTKKLSF